MPYAVPLIHGGDKSSSMQSREAPSEQDTGYATLKGTSSGSGDSYWEPSENEMEIYTHLARGRYLEVDSASIRWVRGTECEHVVQQLTDLLMKAETSKRVSFLPARVYEQDSAWAFLALRTLQQRRVSQLWEMEQSVPCRDINITLSYKDCATILGRIQHRLFTYKEIYESLNSLPVLSNTPKTAWDTYVTGHGSLTQWICLHCAMYVDILSLSVVIQLYAHSYNTPDAE